MKTLKLLICALSYLQISVIALAQAPNSMKYQAVLRDASGIVRADANVSIEISILQGSATGVVVFTETYSSTTNAFGLVNLEIGSLKPSDFANINWAAGPYFVKISVDGTELGTSQLLSVPYAMYAEKAGNGFSGNYTDLTNKPTLFDGTWNSLSGKPALATIANTGSYNDLTNRPDLNQYVLTANTSKWDKDSLDNVTINGTQTVAGNKTFSNTIVATNGLNAGGTNLTNLANPSSDNDAATKWYADNLLDDLYAQGALRVRDYDGNYYNTLKIGDQIWMTENLKTKHYKNGDSIGTTYPYNKDISAETNPKYYWAYGGNENNATVYGRLYTWYAYMDSRGVCPAGWRVPTLTELGILENYLLGIAKAGGKMKEAGTLHWLSPNTGATNESGFTALPAGWRSTSGTFGQLTNFAYFWTDMEQTATDAVYQYLSAGSIAVASSSINKGTGFSVRCLKE
jgi:uncharacterized protein (TIGR02145 family)